MLSRHIFEYVGNGVKIFHGVEFAYGYNIYLGDGAVVRQGAILYDRGTIKIGKGAVIGSLARILSHSHSPDDYDKVTLQPTEIGEGARIGSLSIVKGGSKIAPHEVVGDFPALRN
jgi:acetyltransferase-like isoleucine patch superfamily enzyme